MRNCPKCKKILVMTDYTKTSKMERKEYLCISCRSISVHESGIKLGFIMVDGYSCKERKK